MGWDYKLQNLPPDIRAIVLAKRKEEEESRKAGERHQREKLESGPKTEIWAKVRNSINSGQPIPNWTTLKGYLGDTFEVVKIRDEHLEIETPNAENLIRVSREDFEKVWEVWPGYKAGKVRRQELTPLTFNSKYVISILHWLEEEKK
jgi:hypothetical protein